jgi:hypothetical protein
VQLVYRLFFVLIIASVYAGVRLAERVGFESSDLLEIRELCGSSQSCLPSKVVVRSFYCPLIVHVLGMRGLWLMSFPINDVFSMLRSLIGREEAHRDDSIQVM